MEILKAQLSISRVVDGKETLFDTHEVKLALTNIPGAWKVSRANIDTTHPDEPGVGDSRFSAVADWYGRNFGQKLGPIGVCEAAIKTILDRMDQSQVQELAKVVLLQLGLPKDHI